MGRFAWALFVALSFAAGFATPAQAAPNVWTALGPSAAQVLSLAASPAAAGVVYATTEDRVWKSLDAGETWAAKSAGPTGLAMSMVVNPADEDAVVAAAMSCTVWVSSNGGTSWARAAGGFGGTGFCMPVLAWSPSGLFALARGTLYSSANGGLDWSVVGAPPDSDSSRALVVLPTTPATIYVGTESGTVQLSVDGGATWSDRSSGLPTSVPDLPFPPAVSRLVVDPADSSILYAEMENAGLYGTTDGGLSWEWVEPPASAPSPLTFPTTLATTPTTLIAVGGLSAYRSTDGGSSWLAVTRPPGGLGSGFVTGFYADPSDPNAVYTSAFGVYRSLDAGVTFDYSGDGLAKAIVHALAPVSGSPGSYLAATEGIGVQRTDDDGESWSVANDGVVGQTLQLAAHPTDGDLFFLEAGGHLWKTLDGGANWATSDSGIPYGASAVAVDPSSPSRVYTAVNATVYRSTNGGASWVGSALPAPGGNVRRLAVDPTDGSRVYAGTNAAFYRSTDGGATWTLLHTEYITDLLVAGDGDAYIGTDFTIRRFGATSSTPVLVATLPDLFRAFGEDPEDPQTVYAGTLHGVYQSADAGKRWVKLTTAGLDSEFITDVTSTSPRHVMVAAARGTARIDLMPPAANAAQADETTTTAVRFSGSANPRGYAATGFFEYGPTASYGSTTTVTALGSGTDPVAMIANGTGLSPGTTYHYRLVVQSSGGIAVTDDATFTTAAPPPAASSGGASLLAIDTARVTGSVAPNGSATSYWFEYGTTAAYGEETPLASAGSGTSAVAVQADLTGLSPATTYHYRLVAQSSGGASLGTDRQFTTPSPVPLASTGFAAFVTADGALLQGTVNPNGRATSYWFEYGPTVSYGQVSAAASAGSTLADVAVDATLSGLVPAATYHYRLVAESGGGTSFGADREFTTRNLPPLVTAVAAPSLRLGRIVAGAVPLGLSWTAVPGSGPTCSYEVERGSSTTSPTPVGVVDAPALSTSSRPARGLYFRVRARGCDDTSSPYAASAPVGLRLLQEATPGLERGRRWTRLASTDASGGHVLRTETHGARLLLRFAGRSLALVAPKGSAYAAVSLSVDGAAPTRIDLFRASRAPQLAVHVLRLASAGPHEVVIRSRAVGSRTRVDVDAFAVIG
jgi:photosystem II stability/assembly factor-like uncharacterized protein